MSRLSRFLFVVGIATSFFTNAFRNHVVSRNHFLSTIIKADSRQINEEYKNPVAKFLGLFIPKSSTTVSNSNTNIAKSKSSIYYTTNIDDYKIDWNMKKAIKPIKSENNLLQLIKVLGAEIKQKEWFVTGYVNPIFFSNNFKFEDPDVKVSGIKSYAQGVNKIFKQDSNTRAEIINITDSTNLFKKSYISKFPVTISDIKVITITWRLSGSVNIGKNGLKIKPYIVYTDYIIDTENGLIIFQKDRFAIPGYDIILSALFPFLIEWKFLSPPCPPIDEFK